ncbi:putative 4Fe-4S iron sulfur cluster binding pr [Prochlorococcus marinus str. SS51]|nr:putative 4Fe-4S iron sulfur cluster binding pr [Prochlorococcus marinus str. SS2]KGG25174.1 putative 4Fe-4S iron sulfur cluster binding pr [Prochlorococcus marinus str. SS35]KGG32496.1 putative 4Fe-4S iron sulfur cluster binding pr [Prochlorococcus marinus str. SS51]
MLSMLLKMILLKITNSSEVVKAKAGKLFEKITPDRIDQKLVEAQVIQTMIEQLKIEGLKGEISSVKGLEIDGSDLITKSSFVIRETKSF